MKQINLPLSRARRLFFIALFSATPFFALMFEARSALVSMNGLNFVVNTTADTPDVTPGDSVCDTDAVTSGSQCTLRAAIQEANAVAGDDSISFDPGVTGAISLSSVLPDLSGNVSITGPGASVLTIERSTALATPDFRIFNVPAGVTVSISGLTIRNGKIEQDGGAILAQGTLTVTDCVFTGNSGDSGGAIFSGPTGALTISRTSIVQNKTIGGAAAVLSQVALTMTDSTVSENTVGGGIFIGGGTANIANSTISNNTNQSSGGGLLVTSNVSVTTIVNTTITGNRGFLGGGIMRLAGSLHLRNTIVAGNFNGAGTTPDDINGVVSASSSSNLIGVGGSGGLTNGVNNNKVGVTNPGLGGLVDNGGPTRTHRLLPGSPAIDAGDNCVLDNTCIPSPGFSLSNDQRGTGFARSVNGDFDGVAKVDIGAYEAQSVILGAPFVVTNTNDSGSGSLRTAILDALQNGSGNIYFQEGLTGTITLSTPLPDLPSVNIIGPGATKLTVQRNNSGAVKFRIFTVKFGATATISGLTIANGMTENVGLPTGAGGGISNEGTVTIDGCNITGNSARFGGGVASSGSLTILNSTIANNTATLHGGGVGTTFGSGAGSLRIDRSTISNNIADSQGGGLYHQAAPLALITNTTISSNTALEGGGIGNNDQLILRSVTITANTASEGGGVKRLGSIVQFNNTIIAGNNAPTGPDCAGQSFISEDYNLIGNTSAANVIGNTTHNLTDVNPLLGPLANNGGPTKTHQLLHGSPAVDAGSSTLLTDQRGLPRPSDHPNVANAAAGDGSDIGAYEAAAFEVNSTADADDGACTLPGGGNGCTLREAINAANTVDGFQAITFAPSLTAAGPATITLLTALPELNSDLSITGPGADLLTVERSSAGGTPNFRIFTVNSGKTVSISGFTAANGRVVGPNNGGGVLNNGTLVLTGVNLYGNTAAQSNVGQGGDGGGLMNFGALTLNNCNVGGALSSQKNTAEDGFGGGIWHQLGTLTVNGGSISGNIGGGVHSVQGSITLNGVTVMNNSSPFVGGLDIRTPATVINSLVSGNVANGFGAGGIYISGAPVVVVNSTISGNSCNQSGGGVFMHNNASLTLVNSTIANNRSDADNTNSEGGGGIDNDFGTLVLKNTIVAGNFRGSSPSTMPADIEGTVDSSSSFNLVGTGGSGGLVNGVNSNQVGVADAGLAPLANNGGPTLTHALLSASPALDSGSNSFVANPPFTGPPFWDQRGAAFSRIVDGPDGDATATVDVGAFEQQVSISQIQNASAKEDNQLVIPFDVGDRGSITSIVVSSANETLVPNDSTHLRLTDAVTTELIIVNPAADRSGTADITVVFNRTGGSEFRTFTVTIDPVNDAPTFTRGLNPNVDEDSGPQTIFFWPTNVAPGPADESGQTLSFQITGNTNPILFSVAPSISPTGTLTFTPAVNASGAALITVVLKDNGGTANGGQDTSVAQTFGITVNAVNDAPVNTIPGTQTVVENGVLTFSSANSNQISIADVDAGNAPVQVTLNANNGLITLGSTAGLSFTLGNGTANTAMTFTGTIANINAALTGTRFTPNAGFDGQATLQIVTNDGGNTGKGGALVDNDTIFINVLNGGTLQFLSSSAVVSENGGTATITVTRTGGSAGATSVTYATSSSTAVGGSACTAGVDFINTTATLSWVAGENTPKAFTVTLCDDSLNEEDEELNLTLSAPQGSGQLGSPSTATLILSNDDRPLLLMEENSERAIALDSVDHTRDPFSLLNPFNLSDDHRRRVTLLVWRLGLLPGDTTSNLTVVAEDSVGMTYPLTVENVSAVPDLAGVSQVVVILPDNVIGAPRELWLTVKLRGPATNRASIRIAAP
jgi:CSLREA domain-containing protein